MMNAWREYLEDLAALDPVDRFLWTCCRNLLVWTAVLAVLAWVALSMGYAAPWSPAAAG